MERTVSFGDDTRMFLSLKSTGDSKKKSAWETADSTVMVNAKVRKLALKEASNFLPNENWVNFIYLLSLLSALLGILIIKEV